MSHDVLIKDLRRKSAERIRGIWAQAESEAAEFRRQKEEELARRQEEAKGQLDELAEKVAGPILHKAQRTALRQEDDALQELAGRLFALAQEMLGQLREVDYGAMFAELAGEVPAIRWEEARVNPDDRELAGQFFPSAKIISDPDMTGGFILTGNSGKYRVINTLESRLEKAWPILLVHMLQILLENSDAPSVA